MTGRRTPLSGSALLFPALAFLTIAYVLPLADVLRLSVTDPEPTVAHYARLIQVPIYLKVILNTFEIATLVAILTVLIAYMIAYFLASLPSRWSSALLALVLVPFFTGVLVRNYAWIFMLGGNGVVNSVLKRLGVISESLPLIYNRSGVVIASVHVLLPYATLILLNAMRNIDPRLMAAAGVLSAPPFTAFRRVYLPLTTPALGSAFILVFVSALAFFVTPAMLGGAGETMIANLIAQQVGVLNWGFAAALSTVLLAICMLLLFVMQRMFSGFALIAPGAPAKDAARRLRSSNDRFGPAIDRLMAPLWPHLPFAFGAAGLLYLALPILIVIPLAMNDAPYLIFPPERYTLKWYGVIFSDPDWLEALRNSVIVAAATTVLTMAMAIPAAIAITRSSARWITAAYALILSPMVLPTIIIAIAIFFLLSRIGLTGTVTGLAIGHAVGALPLAVVVLVAALQTFDRNLERAAASLRASPWRALTRVTLPCIRTATLTAAFFAFLHSFDEVMVTIFVSGVDTRTLPKKMWESLQEINSVIPAVSSLLVLLSILIVLFPLAAGRKEKSGASRTRAL